ncbi:MAG: hypothetical protein A2Y38_24365 [Spirochaetes bacterium GWB1_59_5]|nr:MAG: hypothetical protein A2Y38_24365 [Spirochaetes bacterium GWB1_59_5]
MILPRIRDSRFITIRRGGTLTDTDHHVLALWAARCSEHVLHYFENERTGDNRPRKAIESTRAWASGEITVTEAKKAAFDANAAARDVVGAARLSAARLAALSAGQAAAVAHVAAHELGAAAYAIRAVLAASEGGNKTENGRKECAWQHDQLPVEIKELVLDDQKNRNDICWNVFLVE